MKKFCLLVVPLGVACGSAPVAESGPLVESARVAQAQPAPDVCSASSAFCIAQAQRRTRCDNDDAAACRELALTFMGGEHIRQDLSLARTLLKKSCDKGDGDACLRLSVFDRRDPEEDYGWSALEKSCQLNSAEGCATLAKRSIVRGRRANVTTYLQRACALGDGASCLQAGNLHAARGETHESTALLYYEMACEKRIPKGCLRAGRLHLVRARVPERNPQTAYDNYRRLCLSEGWCNGLECKTMLAESCRATVEVLTTKLFLKDSQALVYFRAGCRNGDAKACERAGYIK